MSMINYASREINCKVVYYGTGLGGKTTNLEYVYSRVNPDTKGKMISLATETDRTLFFDFLPIDLGEVRGQLVRPRQEGRMVRVHGDDPLEFEPIRHGALPMERDRPVLRALDVDLRDPDRVLRPVPLHQRPPRIGP